MGSSSSWPLKTGLLIVAVTWFLFTFYEFPKAAINIGSQSNFWVFLTDTAGVVGLGFRTVAGLIAVITVLFFIFRRDLSAPETMMSLRWIIIGEAVYFLSLFPSGIWGILRFDRIGFFVETGIPCLVESIVIPIALITLFLKLDPKKSLGAIKWGLISVTAYVFVFWLNNTANWVYALMAKGPEYVINYPLNLLSFALTTIGLLALTLYAAYFSKRSFGIEHIAKLDLRRVGAIVTALGLYFDIIYLMWIYFGAVGGWGAWYQWFFGHNMDLWVMSLPAVGVPLLFRKK